MTGIAETDLLLKVRAHGVRDFARDFETERGTSILLSKHMNPEPCTFHIGKYQELPALISPFPVPLDQQFFNFQAVHTLKSTQLILDRFGDQYILTLMRWSDVCR